MFVSTVMVVGVFVGDGDGISILMVVAVCGVPVGDGGVGVVGGSAAVVGVSSVGLGVFVGSWRRWYESLLFLAYPPPPISVGTGLSNRASNL